MSVKLKKKENIANKPFTDGAALLQEVISAHGGSDFLEKYSKVLTDGDFGGWALFRTPFRKQAKIFRFGPSINLSGELEIDLHSHYVTINSFPKKGQKGIYNKDEVSIVDSEGTIEESKIMDTEKTSNSLFWDRLDPLYLLGYGNHYYYQTPFIFEREDFQTYELPPVFEFGEEFRRLLVMHPEGFRTHSPEMLYSIGKDGLISHFRYNLDMAGDLKIIHFCSDYEEISGYKFPRRRIMFVENGPFINFRRKSRMPVASTQANLTNTRLIKRNT